MDEKNKISQIKESVSNIKKGINELVLKNKKLERENLNFKEKLLNITEPEEVKKLKKQIEFFQEREIVLQKKIKRLIKRLDNLEIFDSEEDWSENQIEAEEVYNG